MDKGYLNRLKPADPTVDIVSPQRAPLGHKPQSVPVSSLVLFLLLVCQRNFCFKLTYLWGTVIKTISTEDTYLGHLDALWTGGLHLNLTFFTTALKLHS